MNLGCLEEDGRCWLLSLKPLNYTAAWDECRSQGGARLARLDTLEHYYTFKARHEKFRQAFWLWSANPACGTLGVNFAKLVVGSTSGGAFEGHWLGAKVTSSEDWFWVPPFPFPSQPRWRPNPFQVNNEADRDGPSFRSRWPTFDQR